MRHFHPVSDPIDRSRPVVEDEEGAVGHHQNVHGPTPGDPSLEPPLGEDLEVGGPSVLEPHKGHPVADGVGPVSGAVLGDEDPALVFRREGGARVEPHPESSDVGSQVHLRGRELAASPRPAEDGIWDSGMAEGEAEVLAGDGGPVQLVWGLVVSEPVAAVVGKPEVAGIADVAGGSDGDVELSVGAEGDELPAVASIFWKVALDDYGRGGVSQASLDPVEPEDPAHLGDVKAPISKGDAVREVESRTDDEDLAGVDPAVPVAVPDGVDPPLRPRPYEDRHLASQGEGPSAGKVASVDGDLKAGGKLDQIDREVLAAPLGRVQKDDGQEEGEEEAFWVLLHHEVATITSLSGNI